MSIIYFVYVYVIHISKLFLEFINFPEYLSIAIAYKQQQKMTVYNILVSQYIPP